MCGISRPQLRRAAHRLPGGGKSALLCELELELKHGNEAELTAFAQKLMETYHLSEQPLSKLQRARALVE